MEDLQLDKMATKKKVESVLGSYGQVAKKVKILKAVDSDVNTYLKTVVTVGIEEMTVKSFLAKMNVIFETLKEEQQKIIAEKYIKSYGDKLDCDILDELNIPERTYYRYKMQAILIFADLLNLNQYKNK